VTVTLGGGRIAPDKFARLHFSGVTEVVPDIRTGS
jgi:hypothetical protein